MRVFPFLLVIMLVSCQRMVDHAGELQVKSAMDTTQLERAYTLYKEEAIANRRFKHSDMESLLQAHQQRGILAVKQIGTSFEGRSIYELAYGNGGKRVMLWSQMHGDEPTATMALLDLFNFLSGENDGFDSIRTVLSNRLDIRFIPMLNPDGAERYTRRNAQQIDLNRDARMAQTIEGTLLKTRGQQFEPHYAFNLHDQNIYYNVPGTRNPVTISLLAPAYNEEREINEVRGGAMQLIVGMNRLLQRYVPNAVAKYDDTHSPRGFGDNFQSWGASTVLIESGGMKGDPEKQEIRKLNFMIILNALVEIAQESYKQYPIDEYEQIPFNASQMHDVVLRNVQLTREGAQYSTDIALRRTEITVGRQFYVRGRVEDIGDLYQHFGYDDVDLSGHHFIAGQVERRPISSVSSLTEEEVLNYLRWGIIAVRVSSVGLDQANNRLYHWPIVLFAQHTFFPTQTIDLGGTANFFIGDETGQLKYAVVNGYLIDLTEDKLPRVNNHVF